MNSITCTCPQAIRAANHKLKTSQWWKDPEYRTLSAQFLLENPVCEYCGARSEVVHHDNANSYRSKDEYFNPDNFTAACFKCHTYYRNGRIICPVCKQHYISKDGKYDRCRWCRGIQRPGRVYAQKYRPKHPCGNRIGQQRCQRDGRVYVCGWSAMKCRDCDYFKERVKA